MKNKPLFAAIISAAGYSPHFDDVCAKVSIEGIPAIMHCVAAFRESGVETIIVVTGAQEKEIKALVPDGYCTFIRGPLNKGEILPSALVDLADIPREYAAVFVHPVDRPLISSTTITLLAEAYLEHKPNRRWFMPAFDGIKGYPILIPRVRKKNENGSEVFSASNDAAKVIVPVYDEGIVESMTTPEGRATLDARIGRRYIPGDTAIRAMLRAAGTPPNILRHQQCVTETALKIAQLIAPHIQANLGLLKAAAELHDILKTCPGHAERGAALLSKNGFSEVAKVVREHTDLSQTPSVEAEILYLADKYISGVRLEPLEDRERRVREKYAHDKPALQSAIRRMRTARDIEKRLEKITGLFPLWEHL